MKIRKANKLDKTEIQALMNDLSSYREKIFNTENKEFHKRINPYSLLEDKDFEEGLIFVSVDETNRVVGFIQGSIHQRKNHKFGKLGYLDELYTKKESRGKGIAGNLFSELELEFRNRDCDHIITHTDFENELSQSFYLKNGMSKTTIELWKKV